MIAEQSARPPRKTLTSQSCAGPSLPDSASTSLGLASTTSTLGHGKRPWLSHTRTRRHLRSGSSCGAEGRVQHFEQPPCATAIPGACSSVATSDLASRSSRPTAPHLSHLWPLLTGLVARKSLVSSPSVQGLGSGESGGRESFLKT